MHHAQQSVQAYDVSIGPTMTSAEYQNDRAFQLGPFCTLEPLEECQEGDLLDYSVLTKHGLITLQMGGALIRGFGWRCAYGGASLANDGDRGPMDEERSTFFGLVSRG